MQLVFKRAVEDRFARRCFTGKEPNRVQQASNLGIALILYGVTGNNRREFGLANGFGSLLKIVAIAE